MKNDKVFKLVKVFLRTKSQPQDPITEWMFRGFRSPAPHEVKMKVLDRYALDGIWVETGTFMGQTTEYLRSNYSFVYSIEPSKEIYDRALGIFKGKENVKLVRGTSEEQLPSVIDEINRKKVSRVNFWLDGHYSAGITYKGIADTPVLAELSAIENLIRSKVAVSIFVDDVRCFLGICDEYETYPSLNALVAWALKHDLRWTIEHDILILFSSKYFKLENQEIVKMNDGA